MPVKNPSAESILLSELSNQKSPSVQYAFFNEKKIIYEFREGYANLKSAIKVGNGSTFPLFSITKTFTALSVLQLSEKGLIDLDKPVAKYLPEFKFNEKTTIKHLLTHTAGLANPIPINWIHLTDEHRKFNRDVFFQPVLDRNIKKTSIPGIRFRYSNLGYIILGRIIEKLTGKRYEDYVKENVLRSRDLQNGLIDFDIPQIQLHETGYHNKRGISMMLLALLMDTSKYMESATGRWKPFKTVYVNGTPYGGLIANMHGIIHYGRALLKSDNKILKAENRKLMFTENKLNDGRNTGMCLSWFKGRLGHHTYFTHAGGGGGFYCELRLYPEISSGSFVVFNRSGFSDERFLNKVDLFFI